MYIFLDLSLYILLDSHLFHFLVVVNAVVLDFGFYICC